MATKNDTTAHADALAEVGCKLDDARVVLDFMTDMQEVDIADDPKKILSAAMTAFRLVCDAADGLRAVESGT
ncbi:hypothetical protein [[Pseudomonas] boreopolis]|uniref:hypothetical protein n=1 Tax=Xanthomonas boreopolis TaxID=86183 RepID=UPI003D43A2ED